MEYVPAPTEKISPKRIIVFCFKASYSFVFVAVEDRGLIYLCVDFILKKNTAFYYKMYNKHKYSKHKKYRKNKKSTNSL